MSDRAWKAAERQMAKEAGTTRIPVTGERFGADFETPMFRYQLKVRRALPLWLFTWLSGICAGSKGGQVGVLVLNRPRRPRADALVCVRWCDWVALHGVPDVPAYDSEDAT